MASGLILPRGPGVLFQLERQWCQGGGLLLQRYS
jgi:hypothetical protein